MDPTDGLLLALRATCRISHTPEQSRSLDDGACERLFSMSRDVVDAVWEQIAERAVAASAQSEPHVTLAVLHARMRSTESTEVLRARVLLADYATVVRVVDKFVPTCVPTRWAALGREATRIAVGASAPVAALLSPGKASILPPEVMRTALNVVPSSESSFVMQNDAQKNSKSENRPRSSVNEDASTSAALPFRATMSSRTGITGVADGNGTTGGVHFNSTNLHPTNPPPITDASCAQHVEFAKSLLLTLRDACDALAPTADHLVPLHADYLALCVQAKYYSMAIDFALCRRNGIDIRATCLSASDIICVHYYLAVAHIAMHQLATALQHCRLALAVPSTSISDIAVATYKKFVLLSLLVHGSVPAFVKISSYPSGRLRMYASEYADLSKPFESAEIDEVRKLIASNHHVYERDGNLGVVKLLIAAIRKRGVLRLTSSYITLSVEEITTRIGLSSRNDTEALLLDMIDDGSIRATIDVRSDMVRFGDELDEGSHDITTSNDLDKKVDLALKCSQVIRDFHHSVLSDPVYASRKLNDRDRHSNGPDGSGVGMEDEDLELE